jgi:nucleotide-binding universal stress UspA family protein
VERITRKPGQEDGDPTERLRALVPLGASARGISTEVEIVREEHACTAIWHAAGRLGVDAICMATHGRSGVLRVLLGSQAHGVVQRSRQPVILAPPEREG